MQWVYESTHIGGFLDLNGALEITHNTTKFLPLLGNERGRLVSINVRDQSINQFYTYTALHHRCALGAEHRL